MSGTLAFAAGYPTGTSKYGFSCAGRPRIRLRNPIGEGVWVSEARTPPGEVERGEQEPAGDPDRLGRVVVLPLHDGPVVDAPRRGRRLEVHFENRDEIRGSFEKRLVPVGPERRQRLQPLFGHPALVAVLLFGFGGDSDFSLDGRIGDHDEPPGLPVRARRCESCGADRVSNELPGHRLVGEVADRAALRNPGQEVLGASELLARRQALEVERKKLRKFTHGPRW